MSSSVADYREAMSILIEMARRGDVRAAVALAGHLRTAGKDDPVQAEIVELARRRASR
jgi:hypothetical protein